MRKELFIFAGLTLFVLSGNLKAAEPKATVLDATGGVVIFQDEQWVKASDYQPLYEKNIVKTSSSSSAEVMFDDETVVRLEQNTEAQIEIKDSVPEVALKTGRITSSVVPAGGDVAFLVSSPLAIIGVRGTEFTVTQRGKGTDVAVYKGKVELSDRSKKPKKIKVRAGKQSFVYKGRRPSTPVGLSPEYIKYRKTKLMRFVKRTLQLRKQKEKILAERMKRTKKKSRKIIKKLEKKNEKLIRERKKQRAPRRRGK